MQGIERHWYHKTPVSLLLWPFSLLYCVLVVVRRLCYRLGLLRTERVGRPVIVVGNLTVGGSGKTPIVAWLAGFLAAHGYRPGIVSRGYGGETRNWPQLVSPDSDPLEVGDEPVLLARRVACPVMVDPERARAARVLVEQHGCDVIVSDDGLQHYRLARDFEIAVIDGVRRFGNGFCLPAGPLREPLARLRSVDARVTLGEPLAGEWGAELMDSAWHAHGAVAGSQPTNGEAVHAVAGIGNPSRFFAHLRRMGLVVHEHAFPDHHRFQAGEISFGDNLPVLMTEKDAVKCQRIAGARFLWLAIEARPDPALGAQLLKRLEESIHG